MGAEHGRSSFLPYFWVFIHSSFCVWWSSCPSIFPSFFFCYDCSNIFCLNKKRLCFSFVTIFRYSSIFFGLICHYLIVLYNPHLCFFLPNIYLFLLPFLFFLFAMCLICSCLPFHSAYLHSYLCGQPFTCVLVHSHSFPPSFPLLPLVHPSMPLPVTAHPPLYFLSNYY